MNNQELVGPSPAYFDWATYSLFICSTFRDFQAVRNDGTEIRFAYDHQGRRVRKQVTSVGGATQIIQYAAGLYEQHAGHALRHLFFGKRPVATERVEAGAADVRVYYFADHHGTIMMSMNATGAVIHQQRYTPSGLAQNNGADLDRYLDRERDNETELYSWAHACTFRLSDVSSPPTGIS